MGAEQSNSSRSKIPQETITKDEVNRLLQQQRDIYKARYAELAMAAKSKEICQDAQEAARKEARKEVERLMREQAQKLASNNQAQTSATQMPTSRDTASAKVPDRVPAPYVCSGAALSHPLQSPEPGYAHASSSRVPDRVPAPYVCSGAVLAQPLENPSTSNVKTVPQRPSPQRIYPNIATVSGNANLNLNRTSQPASSLSSLNGNTGFSNAPANNFKESFSSQPKFQPMRATPSAPPAPRDRSASRSRNKKNVDDELKCPTCEKLFTAMIFQCQNGHSSCSDCKLAGKQCGGLIDRRVCRFPITNTRNFNVEAYISERKVHCPNSEDGCNLFLKFSDIDAHAKECPFREMPCPLAALFGQCSWNGKLSKLEGHFDIMHQMHRQGGVDKEMVILNLTNNNHIVYLVVLGAYNFLFHAKVSTKDEMLYMTAQLVGTKQNAEKWTYEIHIYNKNEPRKKFQYTDVCNPLVKSVDSIFENAECAIIPIDYAKTFINQGGITYKFFIKKNVSSRNNFGNNQRGRGGARRRVYP